MYSKDGEDYFIVDSHIALWDGRPDNQRNIHGKQFIDCFYDYHRNLSPESEVWPYEEYEVARDLADVDPSVFEHDLFGGLEEWGAASASSARSSSSSARG